MYNRFEKIKDGVREFGQVRVEDVHMYQIERLYPGAFELEKHSATGELRVGLPKDVFEKLGRRRSQHVTSTTIITTIAKGNKSKDPKHIIRTRLDHFRDVLKSLQSEGKALPKGVVIRSSQASSQTKKKKKRSIDIVSQQKIKKRKKEEEEENKIISEETIKKQKIPKSLRGLPPALLRKIQMKQAQKKDKMTKRVRDDTVLKLQSLPRILRAVRSYFVTENKSATLLDQLIQKILESRSQDGIVVSENVIRNQLHDIAKHCSEWCEIDPIVPTKDRRSVFRLKPGCTFDCARAGIEKAIQNVNNTTKN